MIHTIDSYCRFVTDIFEKLDGGWNAWLTGAVLETFEGFFDTDHYIIGGRVACMFTLSRKAYPGWNQTCFEFELNHIAFFRQWGQKPSFSVVLWAAAGTIAYPLHQDVTCLPNRYNDVLAKRKFIHLCIAATRRNPVVLHM